MVLAGEGRPSLQRLSLTLLGGYLCAGSAGAINCYFDRDLDARMERTCDRPIPSGRIQPSHALIVGLLLGLASGLILWLGVHPAAALLALSGFGVYVGLYTLWLKRRSPWNVVIGGLAGAAPPLVGWAAATGTLSPTAFLLAAVVFFWTPAHFWTLALMRREEYAAAGVPMLPVVRGKGPTRRWIVVHAALTAALTAVPPVAGGTTGTIYAVAAGALGGLLLGLAVRMARGSNPSADRRFYLFTLLYLALLFGATLVDHVVDV
jgi:protoheme IX farnesyltransferase